MTPHVEFMFLVINTAWENIINEACELIIKHVFAFEEKNIYLLLHLHVFISNCPYITDGVHTNSFCFPPMLPFLHYYPSTTIYR